VESDVSRGFRILDHTADIGLEAHAGTPAELFRQAALGLVEIAFDRAAIRSRETRLIDMTADDLPALLVGVLEEILYLFDSARFATCDCEVVDVAPTHASVRLLGEPRVAATHRWTRMLKAVTYHNLVVSEDEGHWVARVFLDV
jgi:SHS2 domain-containing protein